MQTVYDIPDEMDYEIDKVIGFKPDFPSEYIMDNWTYQNQALEEITKYMCVFYSTAHWNNEQNFMYKNGFNLSWKQLWQKALEKWLLDVKAWALLKSWPALAKDLEYIKGYSLVQTLDEIKNSLVNNRPIVVGTNKALWTSVNNKPFVLNKGNSYGHAFVIIGFVDNYEWGCLVCKNSYGKAFWDDWKFYIKYSVYNDLLFYSKFSLIYDEKLILEYNKKIMEKIDLKDAIKAFENKFWNWKDPKKPLTREEWAAMIERVFEELKKN